MKTAIIKTGEPPRIAKEQSGKEQSGTTGDRTDPKYIGPGVWHVIHSQAFLARSNEDQYRFISLMESICEHFPCPICQGHCKDYIKQQPMEEYVGTVVSCPDQQQLTLGMFLWSWKFHNAVNIRLRKPLVSWETAYNAQLPGNQLACSKNCSQADGPPDGTHQDLPVLTKVWRARSYLPPPRGTPTAPPRPVSYYLKDNSRK